MLCLIVLWFLPLAKHSQVLISLSPPPPHPSKRSFRHFNFVAVCRNEFSNRFLSYLQSYLRGHSAALATEATSSSYPHSISIDSFKIWVFTFFICIFIWYILRSVWIFIEFEQSIKLGLQSILINHFQKPLNYSLHCHCSPEDIEIWCSLYFFLVPITITVFRWQNI